MTNPAYEATNSDVEKLIAPYESKFSRLWDRYDEACHGNAEHMRDILEVTLNALEGAESDIAVLTSALEQAQQYSKKRDEENQDLMLTIGRLRVEREQLEATPNGMMQLSNELAEMKQTVSRLRGESDTMLRDRLNNMESSPLCVKCNDSMREVAPLCVKLPDESDEKYWVERPYSPDGMNQIFRLRDYHSDLIATIRASGGTVEGE